MKHILAVSLLLASSTAFAETPAPDEMTQLALRDYAEVTAGVRLERRCHFLAADKAKAFEAHVAEIRSGLAAQLADPAFLDEIDQRVDAALSAKGNSLCSAEAKQAIEETAADAEEWATPEWPKR